jgi:WD40 repeat protein
MTDSYSKILTLKNVYGVNSNVRTNIWFIDETNLVYSAGRTLVFHNANSPQTFIKGNKESLGITAMCLVPNRKYIAVAERGKLFPTITFYDTSTRKKKKIITHADAGTQEFVCFSFSADGKFMLAQGGAPSYKLVLWSMEGKSKVVATIGTSSDAKDPAYHCSMSPDNKLICVTGNGIFKLFKYEEGNLRMIQNTLGNRGVEEYLCHTWLDESKIVVANRNGDIFIVDNGEFKASISSAPSDGFGIYCVIPYGKGFICGGDNGLVILFEPDDIEVYRRQKTMRLNNSYYEINDVEFVDDETHRAVNFGCSPSLETLAIATTTGQIFTVSLSQVHMLQVSIYSRLLFVLIDQFHRNQIFPLVI